MKVVSGYLNYSTARCEALRQIRREAVAGQSECAAYKEGKRAFQRQEKAATIVLRYIEGEPGWEPPARWPVELADELRYCVGAYALEP